MLKRVILIVLVVIFTATLFAGCKPGGEASPTLPVDKPKELEIYTPDCCGMVAAGAKHSIGLRSDGIVVSAGSNENGQRDVNSWKDIVHVDASDTMTVGSTREGRAVTTSKDESLNAALRAWTDIVMITAGDAHVVGLKKDGTVVAAGDNSKNQCNVSEWTDIVSIAADANHTIALKKDGTVVAAGDNSSRQCDVSEWTDIIQIDTARYHTLALKRNKTACATGDFDLEQINVSGWTGMTAIYAGEKKSACMTDIGLFDCAPLDTDIMGVNDGASCAVGSRHAVFMKTDGTVTATGFNDELQCEVENWKLRPYLSYGVLVGFAPNSTVEYILRTLKTILGSDDVVLKDANGEMSADAIIHTGAEIYSYGKLYAPLAIIGEVNGDGQINEDDAVCVEKHLDGLEKLSGAYLLAAMVYSDGNGGIHAESVQAIRSYAAGENSISQFTSLSSNKYKAKIDEVKAQNDEIVGWISIDNTDIDYPIMYRKDLYYYHSHNYLGASSGAGSVYAYFDVFAHNNVITAHNMRNAKSNRMFHTLHHIQEFNMGSTECEARACSDMLTDLPDFSKNGGRTWTINIYGVESQWEIFSMYETKEDEPKSTRFDNTWWPLSASGDSYSKTTREEIQEWINKQLERSEYKFPAIPDPDDIFITILTCGTEYDSSDAESRLYFFLRKV